MLNYVNFCQSIRLQGLSPCLNLDLQFAPQNMTVKRRFKIVLIFEIICGILESIIIKYPLPCHVQNVVCLFVLKKIAGNMTISVLLIKIFISPVILKAQITADHILEIPVKGKLSDYFFKNHICVKCINRKLN